MSRSQNPAVPWIKRGALVAIVLAVLATASAMVTSTLDQKDDSTILTHTVRRSGLKVVVTENGTVESSNNEEIKCMVKGGSTVLWVIETGTIVKPGEELVRLDQSQIEDNILAQRIVYESALANKITAESDVAVAEKSITEYLEGTYVEERSGIQKEIFDAEQELKQAELNYESSVRMAAKGLIKTLQLDGEKFAVDSARKALELKQTQLSALEKYKKEKELQTLRSDLRAAKARLASYDASLQLEKARLDREEQQLENCIIRSKIEGMVIFPSMADWKSTPDIEEGAVVREQQTLLVIPDVTQMQVKVGIHESKVDRLQVGMEARIELQDRMLKGKVTEIAEVTKPAGWWTGNLVKYDTIIKIDETEGLKPGMTALVDITLADHQDVLSLPVAAILQVADKYCCWVKSETGVSQRMIKIGDTNDEFTVVTAGLVEGDEVVLNPLAYVADAQKNALQPLAPTRSQSGQESVIKDSEKAAKSKEGAGGKKNAAAGESTEAQKSRNT
ncbi:MAG: efflux RND transporter periplasmic adaptor subunit [Planctomycetota bacterium]